MSIEVTAVQNAFMIRALAKRNATAFIQYN